MEKDHDTGGKCCFCNRYSQHNKSGYLPTFLFWVTLAKLILKGILSYILFEALYKVHNFPSTTNSLKQYFIHFTGMRVARHLPTILYCLFAACLGTIYITILLNMWGNLLIDLYNWIRYTQTIVVINWQPCTGPGQFCLPWHDNFPLGKEIDPVNTCVDYFKNLPIHTQYHCILKLILANPTKS